jgi:hypothetical protein
VMTATSTAPPFAFIFTPVPHCPGLIASTEVISPISAKIESPDEFVDNERCNKQSFQQEIYAS